MKILAFDTSMEICSVALAADEKIYARRHDSHSHGHAEFLMELVNLVFADAGVSFPEIDGIAVTVGPGSFTGVRIGLAAARGFALALERSAVGLSTLEVIAAAAARSHNATPPTRIVAAIDARRGEVYWQSFKAGDPWWDLEAETPPALTTPDKIRFRHPPDVPTIIVGSGAGFVPTLGHAKMEDPRFSTPDAAVLALLAGHRPLPSPHRPPAPLYLRRPDAKRPGTETPPHVLP